jgi:PST family polysaccharide transporter
MPDPSAGALAGLASATPFAAKLAAGVAAVAVAVLAFRDMLPAAFRSADGGRVLALVGIMAPAVFFGVANFMFGSAGLNYLGRRTYFAWAILATGVANLVICGTLASLYSGAGAAVSYALAELTLFLLVLRAYVVGTRPLALTGMDSAER